MSARTLSVVVVAAAFVVAATAPALAQDAPSASTPPAAAPPAQDAAAAPHPGRGQKMMARFAAANTTHDGKLTLAQAQAGMPMVARYFDQIDVQHHGYVTLDDIRAFWRARRAARANP